MNNILTKIETLRGKKTPEEIEILLLDGKLGKIWTESGRLYQFIGNIRLSHLIVEAHEPGFIECMWRHRWKYVVHHKDGNPLNNAYVNLQVMSRSDHASMHNVEWWSNPANAEDMEVRGKKVSETKTEFKNDPKNTEVVESRNKANSTRMIAYHTNPANAKTNKDRNEKHSKTLRNNNGWIDLSDFKESFTVEEYAKANKVSTDTAYHRLIMLLNEGKLVCEKRLIGERWNNIYRRTDK